LLVLVLRPLWDKPAAFRRVLEDILRLLLDLFFSDYLEPVVVVVVVLHPNPGGCVLLGRLTREK
jgi:hypothetical protein